METHQGDRPLRILEPACGDGGIFGRGLSLPCASQRLQECVRQAETQGCFDATAPASRRGGELAVERQRATPAAVVELFRLGYRSVSSSSATRRELAGSVAAAEPAQMRSLERVLRTNIRCGDALLGPDFELPADADGGDQPVDWKRDFACIRQASGGGFDAVIGNPPYVNIRRLTLLSLGGGQTVLANALPVRSVVRMTCTCYSWNLPSRVLASRRPVRPDRTEQTRRTELRRALPGTVVRADARSGGLWTCPNGGCFPDAGVYPYIIIWQKQPPPAEHRIAVVPAASEAELAADRRRAVRAAIRVVGCCRLAPARHAGRRVPRHDSPLAGARSTAQRNDRLPSAPQWPAS